MNVRFALSTAANFTRMILFPSRLEEVVRFLDGLASHPAVLAPVLENVNATDQGRSAVRERMRLGRVDLAALELLPDGTLGREFARHMRDNGLDPDALPVREAPTDALYIRAHMYETHDIWHVVTGFGADRAGELGLNAFYLAQMPARTSLGMLTMGQTHTLLRAFDEYPQRMAAIARGWLLGRRARPLFGVDWKALWRVPLADVRRRFDVDVDGIDRVVTSYTRAPELRAVGAPASA